MTYEVIVEWFVLQVEVTHCENIPPCFNAWNSDWDFYGSRELEFKVLSGNTYDNDGVRMSVTSEELRVFANQYTQQIETALWVEIDANKRRERWAA
ncbi:hypothetical protein CKQ80_09680 [Pseudomonas moraviensis]|uniref:Uncharacterized protein n=1 Tax=Pseudomonas moraviensis TaxID=321662 RepID=A0A2A2PK17_9PSED|nr:hypothetical protein [Pseudomonas moraviensis]PAW51055.1 hypothetical protein CKQ68_27515 [Pseudomonas moraviensis]PAW55565.1 hypothetical protein CKQ80_09680 [Pseudomonas moraviensis]